MALNPMAAKAVSNAVAQREKLPWYAKAVVPDPMQPGIAVGALKAMDPRALRLLMEAKQLMPARIWDFLARHPEDIRVTSYPMDWLHNTFGHRASALLNDKSPYSPSVLLSKNAYAPEVVHELTHIAQALSGKLRGVYKRFPGMRIVNEDIRKWYPQSQIAGETFPRVLDQGGYAKVTNPDLALQALEKWFPKQK